MDRLDLVAELERHHREGYGWALHCCARDAVAAEDVLHDAYQKVLEGRARYDGRATFRTWLLGVIRVTAARERRGSLLRRLRLVRHADRIHRPVAAARPDECLCRDDLQSRVRGALDALPKRQREVLLLAFYHDLSLSRAAVEVRVRGADGVLMREAPRGGGRRRRSRRRRSRRRG